MGNAEEARRANEMANKLNPMQDDDKEKEMFKVQENDKDC